MASTSNPNPDTKGKAVLLPLNLTPEQIQHIIGALTKEAGNTRKPKIKEPSTFVRGTLRRKMDPKIATAPKTQVEVRIKIKINIIQSRIKR